MSRAGSRENQCRVNRQRGIALIVVLVLLGLLVGILAIGFTGDLARRNNKQQQTTDALAKAKEALIGYAAGVNLTAGYRPGDLPCPDINNDGTAGGSCSNGGGTTLGRLPWKTLGIPDLRDGDGERLWYAVSSNFKNNPSTPCTAPGQAGCLNSDTRGTITVRGSDGTIIYDGTTSSGAIAVIISPGAVIQRQGSATIQDRSTAGVNNPINYLDVGSGEDNKDFVDSNTNGFINGFVYDASANVIVNDRVLAITYSDLRPILERRVAKEVLNCLISYAASSRDRYPWAARIDASATGDYGSKQGYRFGRLPDTFDETLLGLTIDPTIAAVVNSLCLFPIVSSQCMSNNWPLPGSTPSCNFRDSVGTPQPWWLNWKEQVFYGVAAAYEPAAPTVQILPPLITGAVSPPAGCGVPGDCLTVNPSSAADKKVVVIVAGKPLMAAGQPTVRDKTNPANYLEGANAANIPSNAPNGFTFTQQPSSASFNDILLSQ